MSELYKCQEMNDFSKADLHDWLLNSLLLGGCFGGGPRRMCCGMLRKASVTTTNQ